MKKTLAITIASLTFAGSVYAIGTALKPLVPLAQRMIEINFYVDNKDFLEDGLLEFAFAEDDYVRRIVEVKSESAEPRAKGTMEIAAPEGALTAVVCGHVKCGLDREMELICGKSYIPSHVAIDKVHQITFSTNQACQSDTATQFVQGR